jgi:hypothetical protein
LCGEGPVSYFEFAVTLAKAVGASSDQVRPIQVASAAGDVMEGSVALRMSHTTARLNMPPQPIDAVVRDLTRSV